MNCAVAAAEQDGSLELREGEGRAIADGGRDSDAIALGEQWLPAQIAWKTFEQREASRSLHDGHMVGMVVPPVSLAEYTALLRDNGAAFECLDCCSAFVRYIKDQTTARDQLECLRADVAALTDSVRAGDRAAIERKCSVLAEETASLRARLRGSNRTLLKAARNPADARPSSQEIEILLRHELESSASQPSKLIGSEVDLTALELVKRAVQQFSGEAAEKWAEFKRQYRSELTQLLVKRQILKAEIGCTQHRALAGLMTWEAARAKSAAHQTCAEQILKYQLEAIMPLSAILGAEPAEALRSWFTGQLYPSIYPDLSDCTNVLASLADHPGLLTIREPLRAIRGSYVEAREQSCRALDAAYLDCCRSIAVDWGAEPSLTDSMDRFVERYAKRRDLACHALNSSELLIAGVEQDSTDDANDVCTLLDEAWRRLMSIGPVRPYPRMAVIRELPPIRNVPMRFRDRRR